MLRHTLLALTVTLLATPAAPAWEWPSLFGAGGDQAESSSSTPAVERPGGREWWRKNKSKAVFVPGKGYEVPGVEGYFDGSGVAITAAIDEQTIQLNRTLEDDSGLLPGLDPRKAATRVREATGYGPDQQVAQALFNEGVELFQEKNYGPAATKFEAAANRWPGTDLASKSLFNRGECHYFDNEFKEASEAYVELLDKHPSTPKLDTAVERLWSIGQFWEQAYFADSWHYPFDYNPIDGTRPNFDTVGHAVRLYEAIRLNDPTGPRADDAIMATAGIHFRRLRYADADYHYSLLRNEYPRSEHQFDAHVLGLQAKLRRYYGPDYDGTPLREAKRLEEITRANFSGRLNDEERTRLTEVRAQVARAIEERDLRMVEYYEGTEHIAAAKYYLARVAREYPDSPAAEQAKTKLAALEGRPDNPDVPLEWLVNLMPENTKYESINSVELATPEAPATGGPDVGRTLIADESANEGTTTR